MSPEAWIRSNPNFRVRLKGTELGPNNLFACDLSQTDAGGFRRPSKQGDVFVDPKLGRLSLHPADQDRSLETGFAQASSFDAGGGAYDRRESTDRWIGDFVITGEPEPWHIGVTKVAALVTDDPDQGGPTVGNLREAVKRWNQHAAGNPRARDHYGHGQFNLQRGADRTAPDQAACGFETCDRCCGLAG